MFDFFVGYVVGTTMQRKRSKWAKWVWLGLLAGVLLFLARVM